MPREVLLLAALVVLSWALLPGAESVSGAAPAGQTSLAIKAARAAAESSTQASSGLSGTKTTSKNQPAGSAGSQRSRAVPEERRTELTGRRDPFKLPPPPVKGRPAESVLGPLPPGIRGLVIGQLRLLGTVRLDATNTMIAVVTNFTNRAYFLRENDTVFNGMVSKITPDSVIFMENYPDQSGGVRSREVVRRLGSAPGEGR